MNKYKKSIFVVSQYLDKGIYLCSNFYNGKHILLSADKYVLYQNNDFISLRNEYPLLFTRLCEGLFILEESTNELKSVEDGLKNDILDDTLYHIVINPTLDCNLNCWYCYEKKVPHSSMPESIVLAICKHIEYQYNMQQYKMLKLSFFGGEPFLNQRVIVNLINFAKIFCTQNNIQLLLDFTTNGTLLSESTLRCIEDMSCLFQITLDGDKERHNKVKYSKSVPDAFSATLRNIRMIQERVKRSFISVRFNFDKESLSCYNQLLSELSDLDKQRTKIILKKVWQVDGNIIPKDDVVQIIDNTLAKGFVVDYYSQGGACFADRKNQVTFNYDGTVYKCTTINNFDLVNSLGVLCVNTGKVTWNSNKTKYLSNYGIPNNCKLCPLLPMCGGPCRKKLSLWKVDDCFLNEINMSKEEYALVQFKIELVRQSLYAQTLNP